MANQVAGHMAVGLDQNLTLRMAAAPQEEPITVENASLVSAGSLKKEEQVSDLQGKSPRIAVSFQKNPRSLKNL